MDNRLADDLEGCFMQYSRVSTKTAEEACGKAAELLENNLNNIDFDDDDDVEKLFKVIQRALNYRDYDYNLHGEAGINFLKHLI